MTTRMVARRQAAASIPLAFALGSVFGRQALPGAVGVIMKGRSDLVLRIVQALVPSAL